MNDNTRLVKKAFADFRNEMDKEVLQQLNLICQNILVAAIRARLSAEGAHDFTGNLLNSIVVVLYDQGEIANVLSSGEDGMVRRPISRQMYARKKPFRFAKDYWGQKSVYHADVPTKNKYADEDVAAFVASNVPSFTDGYCITVAYAVDYADWVESMRQTTGFLETEKYTSKQVRMSFVPLKVAA